MEVLSKIPHAFERSYLPATIDFSSWVSVEPWFSQLENRSLESVEDLELWLKDRTHMIQFAAVAMVIGLLIIWWRKT